VIRPAWAKGYRRTPPERQPGGVTGNAPPEFTRRKHACIGAETPAAHTAAVLDAANLPYPQWLNPGDNTWQLVAATLVGLMSLPGLAVLYGGLVQRKWVVNTMLMAFAGFSVVMLVWVLWAYNMGFGVFAHLGPKGSFWADLVGKPGPIVSHFGEQDQATSGANSLIPFHFPTSTLAYFQFVFAAITPLLFLGSVLGRMKFKAWLLFVPLWITFVYAVNAALLWGGGFFAQKGAVDYSGGYVIHLAAGVTGFTAAAIVGPRLRRDRLHGVPNNLMLVAVGAGILWLGWNGFNGGDPFYAGVDAASAVLNTNIATAAGLLTWMGADMLWSRQRKPTFLGAINGMICGLVGITPSAGWVDGYGAILVGLICSSIVWVAWNFLPRIRPFSKVDDALGVVYTHGFAGLCGGLLVGFLADPGMIEYGSAGKSFAGKGAVSIGGLFYTGSWHQEWEQFLAALWIICFTAAMSAALLYVVKFVCRGLREKTEDMAIGDLAIHDEEVYPQETFAERVSAMAASAARLSAVAEAYVPTPDPPRQPTEWSGHEPSELDATAHELSGHELESQGSPR
jgi:ammonium transporter, Amt family